jgi:hypothetical protein
VTVSAPVRIVALVGLLVATAMGIGTFVLGSTDEGVAATPHVIKPHKAKAAAKPVAKPKATAKPKPKPRPTTAANGLPIDVADALAKKPVVVVALYSPGASVGRMALKEAQAGAALAGAGFVRLNVADPKKSRPLTALLGVLPDPAVLVFERPNEVFVRIDGFADRETVAQAAANARS